MLVTYTLAYHGTKLITAIKSLMMHGPRVDRVDFLD
jgi:hypothetical protein